MINSLLRSGCPDDFLMLGENGQPVFDSAWQIRETLRLRNQKAIADALAIPQSNDSGNRIDWYAPQPGKITRWVAASEEQQIHALRYLEHCRTHVKLLSSQCLRSEKTALQLFGSLLTKILRFPSSQYIYLIDDEPVITFWGFVNHHDALQEDSLFYLQTSREAMAPAQTRDITPSLEQAHPADPMLIPVSTANLAAAYSVEPECQAEADSPIIPATTIQRSFRRGLAWFGLIALLVVVIGTRELPLLQATVISTPEVPSVPKVTVLPLSQSTLQLLADQLKMGSTQFLNGTW